jgi:hypothetical protein
MSLPGPKPVAATVRPSCRIVRNTFDEQPELLLAPPQSSLVSPLLSQIASDLGKSDDLAIRVYDAIDYHVGPKASAILSVAPTFLLETALIVVPPSFDDDLRLLQRVDDFSVQQLVPHTLKLSK